MAEHFTWFIPRQKRQLTVIVDYMIAISETVVGKVWSGNHELQEQFEDELGKKKLRNIGKSQYKL